MALTPQQRLIFLIIAAFILDYIPIVNLPFLWSETFFHEISHGIAALITGGSIHKITLNFNGSGICTTSGGIQFFVSFFGYAGSAIWGFLIYSIASSLSQSKAKIIVATMVVMLSITLIFWARDLPTIVILLILLVMYLAPLYKSLWINVKYFIQLVGVFVILDSIRSPLYLLDGRDVGDGASLSELTWLPEIFWIIIWVVLAMASLYMLWRNSLNNKLVGY